MRSAKYLSAIFLLLSGTVFAYADDSSKAVWKLEGLKTPESTLVSADGKKIYVSNVNGAPTEKDGNGFIAIISPEGKMVNAEWAKGMNAPKGMGIHDGVLYVADIDELVSVDLKSGAIKKKYPAQGAKFLNDIAIDSDGRVYVSDMAGNSIWRLSDGKFENWLQSDDLKSPNGLVIKGDQLIVGAWGKMTNGFETKVPGHLLKVSLSDKSISALGDGSSVGNLDGLEILSDSEFLASDWMAGKVLKIDQSGKAELLFDLKQSSADIGYAAATKTIFVPMMNHNKVLAFKLPE